MFTDGIATPLHITSNEYVCLMHSSLSPPLREFLAVVGSEKARVTNLNCEVVTVVKHDMSPPVVDVTYSKSWDILACEDWWDGTYCNSSAFTIFAAINS